MNRTKFNTATFILMGILTLVLTGMTVYATVSGDAALFSGPATYIVLGVYTVSQIICVLLYNPGKSVYKIGFYFIHIGIPLMLIGFLLYALVGRSLYATAPVNPAGSFYNTLKGEDGKNVDLDFGFRVNTLDIDRYESGGDKMYRSELQYIDKNELTGQYIGQGKTAALEVNKTFRHNGWKLYFMSYSDHTYSRDGQFYLMPAVLKDNTTMAPREEVGRIEEASGSEALAKLLADNKYGAASLQFFVYTDASDTYSRCSASDINSMKGRTLIRIYGENGAYSVYVTGYSVLLLIKQDPGEYFVLAGMIFTMIGAVMTCLLKSGKKKTPDGGEETGAAPKNGSGFSAKSAKPAKGSDKR